MAERLRHTSQESLKRHETHEAAEARPEHAEKADRPEKPRDSIETIQERIAREALSSKEVNIDTHRQRGTAGSAHMDRKTAYKQILTKVRQHLSKPERAFSKLIHQPTIEKVSEASSKTVARPSGILGGGLVAFFGSLLLIYLARRYGFEYSYTIYLVTYIGGFFAGVGLELLIFAIRKARRAR